MDQNIINFVESKITKEIELFVNEATNTHYLRFNHNGKDYLISRNRQYIATIDNVYYLANCEADEIIVWLNHILNKSEPTRSSSAIFLENFMKMNSFQ
jgi:hypothetical protein